MKDRRFWIGVLALAMAAWAAPDVLAAEDDAKAAAGQSRKTEVVGKARTAAAAASAAQAREVRITVNELPSAVRKTLARESYGGQVREVERTTQAGKTTFEADVRLDGSTYEVLIASDGKLLSKTLDDDDDEDEDEDGDDEDEDEDEDDDEDEKVAGKASPVLKR
jgi:hypothetical protein